MRYYFLGSASHEHIPLPTRLDLPPTKLLVPLHA
jgi:hypothetical protein